jgi:membrane fusion protein, multidrug efflux system
MNRRFLAPAAVVVVLAGGLLWYLHRSGEEESEAKPTARVTLVPLQVGPIAQPLEAYGVIESAPGADQLIPAPYDCLVRNVHVTVGTPVAAGDLLLEISASPDSQLLLETARSALLVADRTLSATQERFDLKLATNQELIVARQAEADGRARVGSLQARGLGGDGMIRAPSAGVVMRIDAARGSQFLMGAPLVTVATTQGREARLGVESGDRLLVARNQPATLTSTERSEPVSVDSQVRSVGAALDAATGSLEVRVPVPGTAALMLGEHVRAQIQIALHPTAQIVPRSAVLPDGDAQVLFTVKDHKAVRHEVRLGIANADRLEVLGAGLQAGDAVVVSGNYELTDGMAVVVETAGAEPPP